MPDYIEPAQIPIEQTGTYQRALASNIENDPEYSLEPDPKNIYRLSQIEKAFVKHFTETKSLPLTCRALGLEMEDGEILAASYGVQSEIRRINRAQYMRTFNTRLATIDEIGGYLTALLMDDVPIADRVTTKDKLAITKQIVDINKMKQESLISGKIIDNVSFEESIKDLPTATLKQLLAESNFTEDERKDELLKNIPRNMFTVEELSNLKTLSYEEIVLIIKERSHGNE